MGRTFNNSEGLTLRLADRSYGASCFKKRVEPGLEIVETMSRWLGIGKTVYLAGDVE